MADDTVHDALKQAWGHVLDRDSWSSGLSFLDAGGDSLKLLTLVFEIECKLGIALPLAEFQLEMTIREMAPVVGAALNERQRAPARGRASPAVLLKAGTQQTPVFIGNGLGAHAAEVSALGNGLAGGRAVFALQPQGANGGTVPSDIETFATEWAAAISTIQPSGPYVLIGYSLGGLIMMETARILRGRGQPVALLALIESYPHRRFWPMGAWLGMFARRALDHAALMRRLPVGEIAPYCAARVASLTRHLAARLGAAPAPEESRYGGASDLAEVRSGLIAAEAQFRPRRYSGKIVFFKAATQRWEYRTDPRSIWRKLVDQLEIVSVLGDHVTICTTHADLLAAALNHYIEKAVTTV